MASYRKAVLREIRGACAEFLPAFRPADFDLDMHRKRDAIFVAPGLLKTYGLYVEFSSQKPGDFTGELLIMDAPVKQDLPMGWRSDFHAEQIGIYRVGPFVCGSDKWWQLRDHEEEDFQFFRSLDSTFPEAGRRTRHPHNWRPRDCSVALKLRIHDAARDFLAAIRDHVVPMLPLRRD